jgi:hypothetical protein
MLSAGYEAAVCALGAERWEPGRRGFVGLAKVLEGKHAL